MMKVRLVLFFALLFSQFFSQNLTTEGKYIVDSSGNQILLRGFNFGGWMLQEPYMFQFSGAAISQTDFRNKLINFIGEENTNEFYDLWLENFITEADVVALADHGFNSIRLPMHYNLFTLPTHLEPIAGENTWLDRGFDLVDNLLDWCEQNNIYLILDLHAAPGGQGYGSDINDYDPNYPSLWESEANKNKTISLWGKIAERYHDEPWIGGYDLINETHSNLENLELRNFYIDITNEIRIYDQNHIIFIEGNWYANDFNGLTPPWDDNMVYSFHKYWSYNDSLDWVTWMRDQYNIPLWMGESGENSNQWFTEAIESFEAEEIGWAFWPWKKLESISTPYAMKTNENYQHLINYFRGEASAPSIENAVNGLMQLAEDSQISNTRFQKDVVDAMIRQPYNNTTIPFAENNIPGIINVTDYDLGKIGYAYQDEDFADYHVATNEFEAWNSGWKYRNDGVDIQENEDENGNGYHIGFTQKNEWVAFTVNIEESGFYDLTTRYSSTSSGYINFLINDYPISENIVLYNTGSFENFINNTKSNIYLNAGIQNLKIKMVTAGYNLSNVSFQISDQEIPDFSAIYSETVNESSILVLLNQPINPSSTVNSNDFSVNINGIQATINNIQINEQNPQIIEITLDDSFSFLDDLDVSYSLNGVITSVFNENLPPFNELSVYNNLYDRFLIPGLIEVEDYSYQQGLELEECSDIGGGENFGYLDAGDYADYPVVITESGDYEIDLRIASEWQGGTILLQLIDDGFQNIASSAIPVTGGWQNWQTVTVDANLDEGLYTLRMRVVQPGFNINWIDFKFDGNPMSLEGDDSLFFKVFPNPTSDFIYIQTELEEYNLQIIDFSGKEILQQKNKSKIDVRRLAMGTYFIKISSEAKLETSIFIKK